MIVQIKWCRPIVRKPQSIEAGIPGGLSFRFPGFMRNKHTGCFKGGISGVGIYQSLGRDQRGNWQHNQTRNIMTPLFQTSNPTVDGLNSGGSLTDSFTVSLVGGTPQSIVITINGVSNTPTIPTPNEWGMAVFALILTIFAMLILNNRTLLFSATKNIIIIRSITVNEDGSWSMEVFLLAGGPS